MSDDKIPVMPKMDFSPERATMRGFTHMGEINDLIAERVMGWKIQGADLLPKIFSEEERSADVRILGSGCYIVDDETKVVAFYPAYNMSDALMAVEAMDYKVSADVSERAVDAGFFITRAGDQWAVSVAHSSDGPYREIYDESLPKAICIAALYRKGVWLPEHPQVLWTDEDDFEGRD